MCHIQADREDCASPRDPASQPQHLIEHYDLLPLVGMGMFYIEEEGHAWMFESQTDRL